MKIRDIIGEPNININTTINIVDFITDSTSINQINNTILTPSFKDILTKSLDIILKSINSSVTSEPHAFFIEGFWGSGKSHFLSFLYTLFDKEVSEEAYLSVWNKVEKIEKNYQILKGKKFLIVPIALHYKYRDSIIDIILKSLEETIFKLLKYKIVLCSESVILDYYKNIVPDYRKLLNKNITEFEKFEELDEKNTMQRERKAQLIKEALDKLNIPTPKTYDIKKDLEQAVKTILEDNINKLSKEVINNPDYFYDGIILLIDEFSEYLKGQEVVVVDKRGQRRNRAALELQAVAEYFKNQSNLFMFITAQKDLKILDPLYDKEAGRINHLTLQYHSFVDIFNELILPNKSQFMEEIKNLYLKFSSNYFNDTKFFIIDKESPVQINMDNFYKCYPFHPMTFQLLLQRAASITSEFRAALSYSQTAVDDALDNDITELITPDTLFDYFADELLSKEKIKSSYLKELIIKINSTSEAILSQTDKKLAIKILKYLYMKATPTYTDDIIRDLLLFGRNEVDLEVLIKTISDITKNQLKKNYLRIYINPENNKPYYEIKVRGIFDIEEKVITLSKMIMDVDIYQYFIARAFRNIELSKPKSQKPKYIYNTPWRVEEYYVRHEDFHQLLENINEKVKELPKWNKREVQFIELFVFRNLPFKDEYNKFTKDYIQSTLRRFSSRNKKLNDRLYFFQLRPLNNDLITKIKESLAFELINQSIANGRDEFYENELAFKDLVSNNDDIRQFIKKTYKEAEDNVNDLSEVLGELSQLPFSITQYEDIIQNHLKDFKTFDKNGEMNITTDNADSLIEELLIINIEKFYPEFPFGLKAKMSEDNRSYLYQVLKIFSNDRKEVDLLNSEKGQQKGTILLKLCEEIGCVRKTEDTTSQKIILRKGFLENNPYYKYLIDNILSKEKMDELQVEKTSLSFFCENLRTKYGLCLDISKIVFATLLFQDKIKLKKIIEPSIVFNNLNAEKVFGQKATYDYNEIVAYKTKKLTLEELYWIFSFFNPLFKDNEEYIEKFAEELNDINKIDDIKSDKQKILKDLMENFDLNEFNKIKIELKELADYLLKS